MSLLKAILIIINEHIQGIFTENKNKLIISNITVRNNIKQKKREKNSLKF